MLKLIFNKDIGDKWLFILPLLLSTFGLLMIFNASSVAALKDFSDKFYYFKHQLAWLAIGIVLFLTFSIFDYRLLKKFAFLAFFLNIILLIIVLFPSVGKQIYGGRRWLDFGGFTIQPSEFIKLSFIVYLSTLFEKRRNFFVFLSLIGVILLLLILEPDLGTASIITVSAFAVYFISGCSLKEITFTAILGLIAGPLTILTSPYRKNRLLTFLNSTFDTSGISYHIRQILIALGSGGIFGRGLGQSRQKFLFLPEVTTDSIFAVIAEEFGFLGSLVLIFAFIFLIFRGFESSIIIKDKFGQMLSAGIMFILGLQTIVNLGAMVALIPMTGVPLPFISYGGSSLMVSLAEMGIVYNISKSHK